MSQIKRINVAVGIVFNDHGQVLVGQRVVRDQYYEKWEFPGGKLELGETVEQALKREFMEEIGIELGETVEFMEITHDYPDRHVRLFVRTVNEFHGEIESREGQALKWVNVAELRQLDFLQGNQVMIEMLEQNR